MRAQRKLPIGPEPKVYGGPVPLHQEKPESIKRILLEVLPFQTQGMRGDAINWTKRINAIREHQLYKQVGFESFDAWRDECLKINDDFVETVKMGARVLFEGATLEQAYGKGLELRKGPGAPKGNQNARKVKVENNSSDTTIVSSIGRGKAYLKARLERDHPDLDLDQFKSIRQAAIAMGIIKVPTDLEKAKKAADKLSDEDRQALLAYLNR